MKEPECVSEWRELQNQEGRRATDERWCRTHHQLLAQCRVNKLMDVGRRVLLVIDADLEKHGLKPGVEKDEGEWIHKFREALK
ncbi:MAG: hypothetical protein KGJ23_08810 [Euryarchaeota archaeon]|nr:hypothetical protein [Euryarchaeota archaeon]MDE1836704.1 hypothetical protein [Euryarchaeota archaeon]MDE1880267.1 hypothetical protein [Euryarchaeota archaeon]MDE2044674.1 hypothetical protein [Thermoplasmata archaeon]